jgi:hypothetical protein
MSPLTIAIYSRLPNYRRTDDLVLLRHNELAAIASTWMVNRSIFIGRTPRGGSGVI